MVVGWMRDWLFGRSPAKVLLLGPYGAGKTTVLYRIKLGEFVPEMGATKGFNNEIVTVRNVELHLWDFGGAGIAFWRHALQTYAPGTRAIVFVVDSTTQESLVEARDMLGYILQQDAFKDAILLVLATKQDLPNSAPSSTVSENLQLAQLLGRRKWHIKGCSSLTGDGLNEGFEWLSSAMQGPSSE